MADSEQYGPALPPATQAEPQVSIGPALPPGFIKQEAQEGAAASSGAGDSAGGGEGEGNMEIGPMVSEMSHGDEVVQAAEEFERRSRKMKDQLTVKAEAEPGPSKREEWMTELPPEMGKNIGISARTFSKGVGNDEKDRSEWTDTPADKLKKEKEGKGKKRKREEDKNPAKQRDQQLQQQVDEYNKQNRAESLVDMHQKSKKKKKNNAAQNVTVADSTQTIQAQGVPTQAQTQTLTQLTPLQHQQLQQAQVVTANGEQQLQYMPLSEESLRDSLDLLGTDQKNSEYYSSDYQGTEYNENKPLADLLLNQNMVSYAQDGTLSGATVLNTSQMIAQAYNQAQLSTSGLSQHQLLASGLAQQVGGQMGITIIPAQTHDGQLQDGTVMTEDGQGTVQTINGTTYTSGVLGTSQAGTSISAFLPNGQNVIIASPGTHQQHGNFIFTSTGQMATGMGQNIVIAAPGQQGGYIVKQETQEELAQTLVLASQNPQHPFMLGTSGTHTATLSDGTNVVFTHPPPSATPTSDGQSSRAITLTSKSVTGGIPASGHTIQAQGGMQPVSFVLPNGSFLPQLQSMGGMGTTSGGSTSPTILQMGAKVDKLLLLMQEAIRAINDTNKRLDRLEGQFSMNPPSSKSKKKSTSHAAATSSSSAAATSSPSTSAASPVQSKSELKAALADYLTITDFNNKDELKRNESSSDLFIPVGTVSLPISDTPSPSGETATSTVSELPDQNLLVMNNAAPLPVMESGEVAVGGTTGGDIPDSQSGIAVTIYDTEGATYELGPDSSKDAAGAGARFTTVSQNPKTVIVDPKFWDMLVEDFQKNMTSKQIMSALTNIRKPLVRNMGNNEISICSSVLKEAEEACQGRRERLAKELVFRIFTLGEVYDRNVSGVFYIKGKKMENKHKALDPAKMSAIRFLVMRYPPSVLDNPRLEKLVWKNCVDRINDALRRIYNWIHKLVDINSIVDKLPTHSVLQSP